MDSKNTKIVNENDLKKRRLMFEMIKWLLVVFVIFLVVSSLVSTRMTKKQFYEYLDIQLKNSVTYTRDILYEHGDSLPWLISYWSEHSEDMNIPRDALQNNGNEGVGFSAWYKEYGKFPLDLEEIEALSEEKQKEYAEICYLATAKQFDALASTYDFMYFSCNKDVGSSESMIIFSGLLKNTDDPYLLGTILDVNAEKVEKSGKTVKGEEDVTTNYVTTVTKELTETVKDSDADVDELSLGDKAYKYYAMSIPVYDSQNNSIAVVSVGYDSSIIENEVLRNVLVSEVLLIVSMTGICLIVIWVMGRKVIRPLEKVYGAVSDYIKTKTSSEVGKNLDAMIKSPKKTEIGALAENIFNMSVKIDEYTEEIRINAAEKEKKLAEMDMAKTIQVGQLPDYTGELRERKEFDLHATMSPAKEVGGDFYDFFMIDDDHLALIIADVSDKGVPAALFMMTSKTLLRSALQDGKKLSDAMNFANEQLDDTNKAYMFVTVWAAIVELSTGIVKSINAGHEETAIRRSDKIWRMEEINHDVPLACAPDSDYQEDEWVLEPGDFMFVYTDGVPDALNINGESFGEERLIEVLNQSEKDEPKEVIEYVDEKLAEYVGEADVFDDTTMLCIKYNGRNL